MTVFKLMDQVKTVEEETVEGMEPEAEESGEEYDVKKEDKEFITASAACLL